MSETYLLNILKEASLFPFLHKMIQENNFKDLAQLAKKLDLDGRLVKRNGKLLQFFELIEKKNDIYRACKIPILSTNISIEMNFRLHLLQKFRALIGDFPKWKKNAASFLIIEYLLKENQVLIDYKDSQLISKLNNYFINERGYTPRQQGQGEIIKINSNKLENWCEAFQYFGFLFKISARKFIFNIDNKLLKALIILYSDEINNKIIPLHKYLEWLNFNYFLIRIEGNKVPDIFCKKIYTLCKEKDIKLIKSGDWRILDLSNKPNYLNIPANTNAIEIISTRGD